MQESTPTPQRGRGATPTPAPSGLAIATALYTLFVAYGCLAPLDFHAVSLAEAWSRYQPIAACHPGHLSRTDFAANVLLFLPFGFLWAGTAGAGWRSWGALVRSAGVAATAVVLQALLEFLQIYTEHRSVSLWDVIAGGVGAAGGVAAWWFIGARIRHALGRWKFLRGEAGVEGWIVLAYGALLLLWSVVPLDLTLDPGVLTAKWSGGRIMPIPLASLGADPAGALSGLLGEALHWVPLAGLLVLSGRGGRFVAWCATVLLAVGVESIQLLIQSRVSDTTDLVAAALGGAAGAWIGWRMRWRDGRPPPPAEGPETRAVWGSIVAAALWAVALFMGSLSPFDFRYDPEAIRTGLRGLVAAPFRPQGPAHAGRALSDFWLTMALFAPFGVAAAVAVGRRLARRVAWLIGAAGVLAAAGAAALIESAQVFLPGKVSDSTDVFLAAIGAMVAFAAARPVLRRVPRREPAPASSAVAGPEVGTGMAADRASLTASSRLPRHLPLAYVALFALALLAAGLPGVPYNVRELFGQGGLVAILSFPIAAIAVFAPPILIGRWAAEGGWRRAWATLAWVGVHAGVTWTVLSAGIPLESIHDVVGAPVLGWPGGTETMARFVILFATVSALYVLGANFAATTTRPEAALSRAVPARTGAALLPLLLVGHLVVVAGAATDNLTELMAGGGTLWSSLCIGAALIGVAIGTTALAASIRRRVRARTAALLFVGGLILGWMAMQMGTAHAVTKYGQTFSAMQFLLSADREHYAGMAELLMRYVVAYAMVVLAGAIAQAPFVGLWGRRPGAGAPSAGPEA